MRSQAATAFVHFITSGTEEVHQNDKEHIGTELESPKEQAGKKTTNPLSLSLSLALSFALKTFIHSSAGSRSRALLSSDQRQTNKS